MLLAALHALILPLRLLCLRRALLLLPPPLALPPRVQQQRQPLQLQLPVPQCHHQRCPVVLPCGLRWYGVLLGAALGACSAGAAADVPAAASVPAPVAPAVASAAPAGAAAPGAAAPAVPAVPAPAAAAAPAETGCGPQRRATGRSCGVPGLHKWTKSIKAWRQRCMLQRASLPARATKDCWQPGGGSRPGSKPLQLAKAGGDAGLENMFKCKVQDQFNHRLKSLLRWLAQPWAHPAAAGSAPGGAPCSQKRCPEDSLAGRPSPGAAAAAGRQELGVTQVGRRVRGGRVCKQRARGAGWGAWLCRQLATNRRVPGLQACAAMVAAGVLPT